ncbi:hypothetical protein ALP37_05493 [Pseudomonas amygdali pv. sesami]|nr:hypothetical protein ALP37_05493 [Pseudomonas amygdali pv. sesami]RMV82202.1 hypothetical protein ALP04_05642 [Pseudomonas amygdali pv. sesami]
MRQQLITRQTCQIQPLGKYLHALGTATQQRHRMPRQQAQLGQGRLQRLHGNQLNKQLWITLSQGLQLIGQIVLLAVMGQMNQADGALMLLTQRLTQYAPQRAQPGTGSQQEQRFFLPVRVIAQCPSAQFAEPQRVTDPQLSGDVAEGPGLVAVDMKFQKRVLARKARQRIRPGDTAVSPQHLVLPGAIAQRSRRLQTQTQHGRAEPVAAHYCRRQAVTLRVKHLDSQVTDHSALAGEPPTLLALFSGQGVGQRVLRLAFDTAHQARMATAGTTAIGNRHTGMVQGVEQIAGRCHRPATLTNMQLRHSGGLCRK